MFNIIYIRKESVNYKGKYTFNSFNEKDVFGRVDYSNVFSFKFKIFTKYRKFILNGLSNQTAPKKFLAIFKLTKQSPDLFGQSGIFH